MLLTTASTWFVEEGMSQILFWGWQDRNKVKWFFSDLQRQQYVLLHTTRWHRKASILRVFYVLTLESEHRYDFNKNKIFMSPLLLYILLLCLFIDTLSAGAYCACCCPATSAGPGSCSELSAPSCATCTESWCRSSFTCSITGGNTVTV